MTEQETKEIQDLKENWVTLFEQEGEEEISQAIEQQDTDKLTDKNFINDLKQISSTDKGTQYLESFIKEVREAKGESYATKLFQLEKYQDLNKSRIAQEMADFSVHQLNIHPVDIDTLGEQTELYQYQVRNGLWEYLPKNRIGRLCKDMGKNEYTRHLQREFKLNIYNHPEMMQFSQMGLPEDKLLLNDKEVLEIKNNGEYQTREVEKEDQALYKVRANYNPEAECPRWKELVEKTLDNQENQIKTLQEFMGWLLKYPNRDHKKALLILGVKDSGKSQIAEVVEYMFNNNAVSNLSMSQIGMERRFHIDKLGDSIVNLDKDMSASGIEANDTIKQLISQEVMEVEPKGEDSFGIDPKAKFMFCSNVAPRPDIDDDGAFYGRFLTLKAPNAVPKEDQVPNIGKKIYEAEKDGILNWMLEGLERLERNGRFTIDPSAYETKLMWNEYGNSVNRFVWDCVEQGDSDDVIPTEDLYEEYEIWLSDKLQDKKSHSQFVHEIKKQPFIKKSRRMHKGSQTTCFSGCKVVTDSGNLETN